MTISQTSTLVQHAPLEGATLAWMTLGLSLASFMQILDITIANVALSTIAGDLGMATTQGTWVITAFGVANAIAVPMSGWLARQWGEIRLFAWAMLLFVVTSLFCGLSTNIASLVLFRILQGLAAGPLVPLAQSLLLNNYPPEKRSMALALWSLTVIVAPICGPILGGWISDNYHWSWIFFINIPVGLLALLLVRITLKGRETATLSQPIDRIGLWLLVIGVGSLQWVLDRGKELDWFASREIMLLAISSGIALTALVIWELTEKYPILDLSLFKQRNFSIGVLCLSSATPLYMGTIVLVPLLLQSVLGYTATWAGLAAAPIGLLPLIISPLIGRLGARIDMRWVVTISFLAFSGCFYWRAISFFPGIPFSGIAWPQFFQGLAVACFFMPLTTITLSGISERRLADASSLSNFLRTLSGSIGTSITTTLWERREIHHHQQLTGGLDPSQPLLIEYYQQFAQWGQEKLPATVLLIQQITQQALIIAANEIFWAASWIFLGMIVIVWFAKPPFGKGTSDLGH
ncbi:MAG: DHA2 family efflux MFS transporter permease subunit [Candidatus Symbiodolus clandestinus]